LLLLLVVVAEVYERGVESSLRFLPHLLKAHWLVHHFKIRRKLLDRGKGQESSRQARRMEG
jgi:hypothetical protein